MEILESFPVLGVLTAVLTFILVVLYLLRRSARKSLHLSRLQIPSLKDAYLNMHFLRLLHQRRFQELFVNFGNIVPILRPTSDNPNRGVSVHYAIGMVPKALVITAEAAEAFYRQKAEVINKGSEYDVMRDAFGGIFSTKDAKVWSARRRLMNPAFSVRIINSYGPSCNKHSRTLLERLQLVSQEGKQFDVMPFIHDVLLDIVFDTLLGYEVGFQKCNDLSVQIKEAYFNMIKLSGRRLINPLFHSDLIFAMSTTGIKYFKSSKFFKSFLRKIIEEKKAQILREEMAASKESSTNHSFTNESIKQVSEDNHALNYIIRNWHVKKDILSVDEIISEVTTMILGGEDTSASTVAMTLYLLGHHPQVQEKVHMELDEVFQGDRNSLISLQQLKNLKYLQCVVNESMRLYPPVGTVEMSLGGTEKISIDGVDILPGMDVIFFIKHIHLDPKHYPNPFRFIPERFMSETEKRNPYAFMPFSAGPRRCIGSKAGQNQMLIVLAHILRNFMVRSENKRDTLRFVFQMTLHPIVPIPVWMEKRH